jgi:vancomycin resistance protein YoaR
MKMNKMPIAGRKTIAISFAALLLLIPIIYALWFNLRYQDTSFPGIDLEGKSYTGLSRTEAEDQLSAEIAGVYTDGMTFSYYDKTFKAALSELGCAIDVPASVGQIFSYGHGSDLPEALRQQAMLLSGPVHFEYILDCGDLPIKEERWKDISVIETPAQDFSYDYDNGNFIPVAAEEGFVIDRNDLEEDIRKNLLGLRNDPIALQLVKDDPEIREDDGEVGLRRAKNLLTYSVTLKYEETSWNVPLEDFGSWIGFAPEKGEEGRTVLSPAPDTAKIQSYLVSMTPQVNREPVNATLELKDGKVSVFALSQDGIELDMEASADKIGDAIFQEAYYEKAATPGKTEGGTITTGTEPIIVELIVKNVAPELTTDNIDNLGLTKLLATGESDFHGSTKSRVHNVTVGASRFNGVLIGPGDTFSFNSILGEVGPNEGYLPELVIKQGKTIAEYGGGLCQVSTTAFRGAVAAGLEVTERSNHAYAVKYYAPQGTDATIYPPHPDLAFINNTPNYILLQTHISGTKLYFDYYGTDDDRKVETEGPVVYERSAGGAMKTWWKQRVYDKDGNMFLEKTFYSNYKPASLYPTTNPLE